MPAPGNIERIPGTNRVRHQGFERMTGVVDRAGWAGEVVDTIDGSNRLREMQCRRDICFDDVYPGRRHEVGEILATTSEEIVDDDDLVPVIEQSIDQMTADHAGATGNHDLHGVPLPVTTGAGASSHRFHWVVDL